MSPDRSVVEDLASRISAAIVSGEFEPGVWLRQEALAERFKVSRQPVREALRHVQAQGLVEIHHRRGVLVREASPRDVRDTYRIRAELEGLAVEFATRRANEEKLDRIRATEGEYWRLAHASPGADSPGPSAEERGRANDAFHAAVLDAAGCQILTETLERLLLVVPRGVSRAALSKPHVLDGVAREHRRIREAIEAGDTEGAREAMIGHIRHSGELVAERYEGDNAGTIDR